MCTKALGLQGPQPVQGAQAEERDCRQAQQGFQVSRGDFDLHAEGSGKPSWDLNSERDTQGYVQVSMGKAGLG